MQRSSGCSARHARDCCSPWVTWPLLGADANAPNPARLAQVPRRAEVGGMRG